LFFYEVTQTIQTEVSENVQNKPVLLCSLQFATPKTVDFGPLAVVVVPLVPARLPPDRDHVRAGQILAAAVRDARNHVRIETINEGKREKKIL
jgi:hypothetical protein